MFIYGVFGDRNKLKFRGIWIPVGKGINKEVEQKVMSGMDGWKSMGEESDDGDGILRSPFLSLFFFL